MSKDDSATPSSDVPLNAAYANECRVGQNSLEFVIDFGQHFMERPKVFHTRIVTSPVYMVAFVSTMLEALEAHRLQHEDISRKERGR